MIEKNLTLTPFENRLVDAVSFGAGIIESLKVHSMITMACAIESDYSKNCGGAPPLSMINDVNYMWNEVAKFAIVEA